MTFEQLKKAWHAIETPTYTEEELRTMLIASHVSRFRKLKRRLITEVLFNVLLVAAGVVILNVFSGQVWLFTVATGCMILLVFDQYVEHFYLRHLPANQDWHISLKHVTELMKELLKISHFANVGMSIAWLLILTLRARQGSQEVFDWAFLIPIAFAITHLAPGFWMRRVVDMETLLDESNEEKNRKKQ
jgi:hypothetical protein